MIAWLEAVSLGLNQCSWQWEGEGPDYSLGWNGSQLVIEENSDEGPDDLRMKLDRGRLVAAFYRPFRRFVESSRYRPAEYESRRVGEIMVEAEGHGLTEEELRGRLLTLGGSELESMLHGWQSNGIFAREEDADRFRGAYRDPEARMGNMRPCRSPYVTDEWDDWDTRRRPAPLCEIFDLVDDGHFGSPLRGLRSEIVERFLDTGRAKSR